MNEDNGWMIMLLGFLFGVITALAAVGLTHWFMLAR